MPKYNTYPAASTIDDGDILLKDEADGSRTEKLTAAQLAEYVANKLPHIPEVDSDLEVPGAAADAKTTGDKIINIEGGRIPFPVSPKSKYGAAGQVLRTLGNGQTEWVNPVLPPDDQIAEVISEWLDEHPESTTTVQDGSITYPKFANDVKQKFFEITPDDFPGTDTQKLQAALDSFGSDGCGTLIINREYTVSANIKIKHVTFYGKNNRITVMGLSPDASINMGEYSFVGLETEHRYYGGITFENVHLKGTGALFDFTNMIRICLFNCSIENFEYVVYSTSYIQSVQINMCLLRDCTDTIIYSYGQTAQNAIGDVVVTGSLIERCNKILDVYKADGVVFDKNCIEASHGLPFKISGYSGSIVISGNYFESNNSAYNDGDVDGNGITIDMSDIEYSQSVSVINNFFSQRSTDTVIILPDVSGTSGSIVIQNNGAARTCNLINASPTLTTPYKKVIVSGNFGDIVDPNNLLATYDVFKDQSVTYSGSGSGGTIAGTYTFKRIGKTVYLTGTVTLTQATSGARSILPKANFADLYRPGGQYHHVVYDNNSGNAIKLKWSAGATLQAEIPADGDYEFVFEISYPALY